MARHSISKVWSALAQRVSEVIAACALGLEPHLLAGPRWRQLGEATPGARVAIAALVISGAGLVGIMTREGYRGQAYSDPVHGAAVPTIGFGSTQGVKLGDRTDPVSAANRTLREVQFKEGRVKACAAGVYLHPWEYDAYIELTHNIGEGNFCGSSIVQALRAQEYSRACDHILDWKYSGRVDCSQPNKVCGGLWADRLRLHKLCTGGGR